MGKRIFYFILTNLLVMATIGAVWTILTAFTPLGEWAWERGINVKYIAVLSLLWGFGGSFISLLMSKFIAKSSTGMEIISPATATGSGRWLVETVHRLAKKAGLDEMPEVGVYPGSEVNAFATGPSRNNALVGVSAGLLNNMKEDEIEGVLGHEISHVANGDMVTMTLVQGVVNAFVIFLSYTLAILLSNMMRSRDNDRDSGGGWFLQHMLVNLLQMVLGIGALALVIAPFSRWREFRADKGGAEKAGRIKMIHALEALKAATTMRRLAPSGSPELAAFKISGGMASLFATHPPLDERIARLKLG